ncbi:hypothetical protein C8R46DRAFT_1099372 [Mycena filopes]|nr:hypothetical protein C8R46DRAFT_1120448 [Mycena filopes]KAJ7164368.1 hypothetical protein C8R46DRAFT_1099372 [Mycena filopes]
MGHHRPEGVLEGAHRGRERRDLDAGVLHGLEARKDVVEGRGHAGEVGGVLVERGDDGGGRGGVEGLGASAWSAEMPTRRASTPKGKSLNLSFRTTSPMAAVSTRTRVALCSGAAQRLGVSRMGYPISSRNAGGAVWDGPATAISSSAGGGGGGGGAGALPLPLLVEAGTKKSSKSGENASSSMKEGYGAAGGRGRSEGPVAFSAGVTAAASTMEASAAAATLGIGAKGVVSMVKEGMVRRVGARASLSADGSVVIFGRRR